MTWEDFYDNYPGWADSTVASRLSQISDIRNADTADIVECCQCIDDRLAKRLLRKARAPGVTFTIPQAIELAGFLDDDDMVLDIVKTATGPCSREELEELNAYVDDETITVIAKRLGLRNPNEGAVWQPGVLQKQIDDMADAAEQLADNLSRINKKLTKGNKRKKSGLGLFAFLGMLEDSGKSKQSSGFRVGDHVRVKYRGQEGTVIDINDDLIMVSLEDGSHVDSYTASQLEKAW